MIRHSDDLLPTDFSLRLFVPERYGVTPVDRYGLHPDMTITDYFRTWVIDNCLPHARPRNLSQYMETIGIWEESTAKVRISEMTQGHVSRFLKALRARKGKDGDPILESTVRKHCVSMQFLLDRLGPRSRFNPEGVGLIADPPHIKKPKSSKPAEAEDVYTLPEIALWLAGCEHAHDPMIRGASSMPPAHWWRGTILIGYITGMRLESLLSLRLSWISRNEYGWWVSVPTDASKTKQPYKCYLGDRGHSIIQRATEGRKRDLVFGQPVCMSWLHSLRRHIMERCMPVGRRFGWHALRKACGTQLASINPMASSMQLGHATGGITRDHYVDRKKLLSESVDKMPMPAWEWPDKATG